MKSITFSILVFLSLSLHAQETFTANLQKRVAGQGVVVLCHDAEIDCLVNTPEKRVVYGPDGMIIQGNDTLKDEKPVVTRVLKSFFRIQVYTGGNSRDAQSKAKQIENQVRSKFPDLPIYTRFESPRWICQVGNFKTREEATAKLSELRAAISMPGAVVVKCRAAKPKQ